MRKRKLAYKKKSSRIHKTTIFFKFFPLVLLVAVVVGLGLWYQSRRIPDLGEQDQMTTVPQDVKNVLGASSSEDGKPATSIRIPIFMYHYVEYVKNDPGRQNLTTPPNVLMAQIETLKQAGYTFVTPQDVTIALAGRKKLSQRSIVLSFDDGHMDFYTDVFPILQKENVKAVAYIITDFLDRPDYLFTYQLKELAKSPLIEIGAHTMDHYALAGMDAKDATYQIAQSRKFLQNLLHVPVGSFAYPYGSFDQQAIQIVKDAGFTNAVSVVPGIVQTEENRYFLFRLRPGARSGQALLDYLQQDTFQPW